MNSKQNFNIIQLIDRKQIVVYAIKSNYKWETLNKFPPTDFTNVILLQSDTDI